MVAFLNPPPKSVTDFFAAITGLQHSFSLAGSDTAGGTDAAVRSAQNLARTGADTAGGTDSATRSIAFVPRTGADTAGGTDAATRQLAQARTGADTAGATDSAKPGVGKIAADTAGGTDVATRVLRQGRTGADTAGGTDSSVRTWTPSRTAADNAHLGASLILDEFGHPIFDEAGGLLLAEGGPDVDFAIGRLALARTPADTAGGTDVATRPNVQHTATAADTAGGTDVSTRLVAYARTAADNAAGSDFAVGSRGPTRIGIDAAGGTDAATRLVVELRVTVDSAGGTDVAIRLFNPVRTAADTAGGSEAVGGGVTQIAGADHAGGTDTATGVVGVVIQFKFCPPLTDQEGPVNPDTPPISTQYRLRGYYKPFPVGQNIWKLPDGSYTANQPYPLITKEQVRNGEVPINGLMTPTFDRVYYAGHIYVIDATEAAALTAAGFTVTH